MFPCCYLKKVNLLCPIYFYSNGGTIWRHQCSTLGQLTKGFHPRQIEENQHSKWSKLEANASCLSNVSEKKPKFTMILPPPNVTGDLHLGHALMCTIQDIIARRKRQQGFNVIWIPGTDHAGIATQIVVEKKLFKEKKITRQELGKKQFLEEVFKWKNEKEHRILYNLRKLGCTLNWDRKYFTMDEGQENAVSEAFIRLFNEGLIVRENSLVNWSCYLESAISDIEVETKEIKEPTSVSVPGHKKNIMFGQLFEIAYRVADHDDEVIVSTTRPETLLGDVAVAVHPEDERFQKFRDKSVHLWHPFRKERIPLIFDSFVNKEFGTGAVKITPAHDKTDFEIARRHHLKVVQVFTEQGRISENFSEFQNTLRFEARDKVLNILAEMNLLRNIKPHTMNLPICSRSKDIVEYMLKEQWFLKCQQMAKDAIEAVKSGRIKIHPQHFETNWFRWLSDCRDWCISRQLWWGHQIPVYHCMTDKKSVWIAAKSKKEAISKAENQLSASINDINVIRDSDVLDTWFSSSLLPFSVFNWPKEESFNLASYPLDLMETGHDILFFWVARMVMLGQKLTNEVPFRNILLNGIVCDAHGRKMSKSLGNVIFPEQVINGASFQDMKKEIKKSYEVGILSKEELEKSTKSLEKIFPNGIPECGTDSLRFTLCSHNIKNHFINFDVSECNTNRLFFNKIWQATRFTLSSFDKMKLNPKSTSLENLELSLMDKWILSRLANTRKVCNQNFDQYNFHQVTSALKTFFYSNFCDVYLESTKRGIQECLNQGKTHCTVLAVCLSLGLQTMSSITPYLSEELLQHFSQFSEVVDSKFIDNDLESEVKEVLTICSTIRQLKSQNQILKKHEPKVYLFPQSNNAWSLLCKYQDVIKTLSICNEVFLEKDISSGRRSQFEIVSSASHICSFAITTNEKFGKNTVTTVINKKKLEKLQNDLNKLQKTIASEGYKAAANEKVQKKHLDRIKQLETEINNMKKLDV